MIRADTTEIAEELVAIETEAPEMDKALKEIYTRLEIKARNSFSLGPANG